MDETASTLVSEAQKADRRIRTLESHMDWLVEGLSMIEDGETPDPRAFSRHMIRATAHLTDFAKRTADGIGAPLTEAGREKLG